MVALFAFIPLLQSEPETVVYSHAGGVELHLAIYRGEAASKPSPALMLIHGGGWVGGDWRGMGWLADMFVPKGFVCASVEYRFTDKFKWPAQLDDVQTAVRFLRAHAKQYNIDPRRIGAAGDSAGGHLSQCLGVRDTRDPHPAEYPRFSSRVQAVWNLYGPNDLTATLSNDVKGLVKALVAEDTPANVKDASPFFFASRRSAPTFFIQGKNDPLVPWQQAQEMADKLKSVGVEAELNLIDGMGHGLDMGNPEAAKAAARVVDWMVRHLK